MLGNDIEDIKKKYLKEFQDACQKFYDKNTQKNLPQKRTFKKKRRKKKTSHKIKDGHKRHFRKTLSRAQKEEIVQLFDRGWTKVALSKEYGVSEKIIRTIIRKKELL